MKNISSIAELRDKLIKKPLKPVNESQTQEDKNNDEYIKKIREAGL